MSTCSNFRVCYKTLYIYILHLKRNLLEHQLTRLYDKTKSFQLFLLPLAALKSPNLTGPDV